MTVRSASPADAVAMAAIHAESVPDPWSGADLAGWLARDAAFAAVAEEGGQMAGFGLALATGDDAELLTLAVTPGRRRQGWGRAVLEALGAEAAARALSRWVLEVATDNEAALVLYRSEGFVEISRRRGYYPRGNRRVDAIVMMRPVVR